MSVTQVSVQHGNMIRFSVYQQLSPGQVPAGVQRVSVTSDQPRDSPRLCGLCGYDRGAVQAPEEARGLCNLKRHMSRLWCLHLR